MVLAAVLGAAILGLGSLPFGGYAEMGFWERFIPIIPAMLPIWFIAQPEWERRDAEKRARRQAPSE